MSDGTSWSAHARAHVVCVQESTSANTCMKLFTISSEMSLLWASLALLATSRPLTTRQHVIVVTWHDCENCQHPSIVRGQCAKHCWNMAASRGGGWKSSSSCGSFGDGEPDNLRKHQEDRLYDSTRHVEIQALCGCYLMGLDRSKLEKTFEEMTRICRLFLSRLRLSVVRLMHATARLGWRT